jgi:hypothetical protein
LAVSPTNDTAQERSVLDKLQPNRKTVEPIKTGGNAIQVDRRQLAFPMLAPCAGLKAIRRHCRWNACRRGSQSRPIAFSSEVDTGSREENASKQKIRASVLIQSEPKRL